VTPSCAFPARELHAFRSSLVAEVTRFEESGVAEWPVQLYAEQLLLIRQLRLSHEALNNYKCWYSPAGSEGA
jgi:hypothetical protein